MAATNFRLLFCICSIVLIILFIFGQILYKNNNILHKLNIELKAISILQGETVKDDQCLWKFHKYTPSDWETFWLSNIDTFQYEVCKILARPDQINKTIDVLLRIISLQKSVFDKNNQIMSIDTDLSKMHYRGTCAGKQYNAIQSIEPLIGLIRDPLTMCNRLSSVPSNLYLDGEFALQSKRFLLPVVSSPFEISPSSSLDITSPFVPWIYTNGGKKILIDIGCSYFQSRNGNTAEIGTKWFYDYFNEKSIRFDRIIGYEYQILDVRRVWNELPDDVYSIYTFINVGVEEKFGRFNPWTMIEKIAKPNDYVVVKLDIDRPPLENALIKQLLDEDNQAKHLIDEFFFEKHVSNDRTSKEDKLKDTYELYTKLRKSGIRMHGWP